MKFFEVVNIYGLFFAAALVLPYVIFYKTRTVSKSVYTNRAMLYINRIGRFFSVFLMAVNIGVLEKGFTEPKQLMERFWLISTAVLTLGYLLLWFLYLKTEKHAAMYACVIVAAVIVIFSGILQVKTLLMTAGIVYLIGELYTVSAYFKHYN